MKLKIETLSDDGSGHVDFKLIGCGESLFPIIDEAYYKYGNRFLCPDLNLLNYLRYDRRTLEIIIRFIDPDDALMFKLSLLTD